MCFKIKTTKDHKIAHLSDIVEVDLLGDGRLAQVGAQDRLARLLVRQRDVDELIQTARTEDGRVDYVRPVGSTWNMEC